MKKVFALLMALVMVLGMIPSALAAESGPIESVEVNGTLPVQGTDVAIGQLLPVVTMSVPQGADYTVTAEWDDPSAAVEAGKVYRLLIKVETDNTYGFDHFAEDFEVLLNGAPAEEWYGVDNGDPNVIPQIVIPVRYSFKTSIEAVEIAYAEPETGKAAPAVTVPATANYVLDPVTGWYDEATDEKVATIEKGKNYDLIVDLIPKEGYEFAENAAIYVNDVEDDESYTYNNEDYYRYEREFSFEVEIDTIEVTYAAPEAGKAVPEMKVPEGANYELTFEWVDLNDVPVTTVADKQAYYVYLELAPKVGYKFASDVVLLVNGEEVDDSNYFSHGEYYAVAEIRESVNLQVIDQVEINYAAPEVGKPLPEFKLPEGANYELTASTQWSDPTYSPITAFEEGEAYWADIYVRPMEGYEFSKDVVVLINGAKPGTDWGISPDWMNVGNRHSFKTAIDKVELPAWPEMKVGDPLPVANAARPDGAKYTYSYYWEAIDDNGDEVLVDGTVEKLLYELTVEIVADEGCEFSGDAVVTIGGEAAPEGMEDMMGGMPVDFITKVKVFNFSDVWKVLDKVEITCDVPAIGGTPGKVTASGDGYTLGEYEWMFAMDEDESFWNFDEVKTFAENSWLVLAVELELKDNYMLDPNVQFYVNGKQTPCLLMDGFVILDYGQLTKEGAPATGDNMDLVLWGMLLGVSALGAAIVLSRKRYAK